MGKNDRPGKKKEPAFHNSPFKGLKLPETAAPARPTAPAPAPKKRLKPRELEEDAALFRDAMYGVTTFTEPRPVKAKVKPGPGEPLGLAEDPQLGSDDAEALAQLAELVSGQGDFDLSSSDDFIEGATPGVDRTLVTALRRGDYPYEAQLDLHGLSRPEAREAVENFLPHARRDGKRCVLIIHGRGLHSRDQIPVLKEQLRTWLERGKVSRIVLACATARPQDGGAGALYVLLRR